METEVVPSSPPMCDTKLLPWHWGEEAHNANLSPGSSCSSPEYGAASAMRFGSSRSHRRGRPRADALTNLMIQGSTSPSSIKCTYCHRVFPREKSLQAHLRTHTGTPFSKPLPSPPKPNVNKTFGLFKTISPDQLFND